MIDIGWQELFIVAIVLILVVGPKDLPKVLQTLGRWMGQLRRVVSDFQRQIDVAAQYDSAVKSSVKDPSDDAGSVGGADNVMPPGTLPTIDMLAKSKKQTRKKTMRKTPSNKKPAKAKTSAVKATNTKTARTKATPDE